LSDGIDGAFGFAQDGLEEGEVESEEDVLDDDDAEDQAALRVRQSAQLDEQLGDDRRGGDANSAGDDECLAGAPSEDQADDQAAADVEDEVGGTDAEEAAAAGEEVVEAELETEVE
jgi:hypothetical protein